MKYLGGRSGGRAKITPKEVRELYKELYVGFPALQQMAESIIQTGQPPGAPPGRGKAVPPTGSNTGGTTTKTGTRVAAAGALVVLGASVALNWLLEWGNERRIRDELARKEPMLLKEQGEDPTLGFLLVFRYEGGSTGPEGSSASPRFKGLSWRRGYTQSETAARWKTEPSIGAYTYETAWINPLVKPSPMVLATPFKKIALAKFANIRKIEFQKVKFKEWGGFDTDGRNGPVDASKWDTDARAFRFLVLRVPPEITIWSFGRLKPKEVESEEVAVVGGQAPALVLDGTTGVTVWPADGPTEVLFSNTTKISDKEGKLRTLTNIESVRWLPPEQVHLVSQL